MVPKMRARGRLRSGWRISEETMLTLSSRRMPQGADHGGEETGYSATLATCWLKCEKSPAREVSQSR